jgi:hypothetical protein
LATTLLDIEPRLRKVSGFKALPRLRAALEAQAKGTQEKVDHFAYFRDVLMRIHAHPAERIAELIPREWKTRFGSATPTPNQSAA